MFEKLFEAFNKEGKDLYHVGGSVRDKLLGKRPKDYDFTTNALPNDTIRVLENVGFRPWALGEKFGTVAVFVGKPNPQQIEITTHRRDMTPGRHPDVSFTTDLKEDLARRDFTINSIAMDMDGNLIDPFGGAGDLSKKIIKTTGNPYERFSEDPLRMLRAARFFSQLGFTVDINSFKAIREYAQSIMVVSKERWLDEMDKLLVGPNASKAVTFLRDSRLLWYILPELCSVMMPDSGKIRSKNLWYHIGVVIEKSIPRVDVRWAALLHDIAKPQTRFEKNNEVHFFQHECLGAEMVEGIARRLKMGNRQRRRVKALVFLHQRICNIVSRRYVPPVSKSGLRRLIRECDERGCSVYDLIDLFEADCSSQRADVLERQSAHATLLREAVKELEKEALRPQLPSGIGNEIMSRFNLTPGPEVGKIKKVLDEMLLDGKITGSMSFDEIFSKMEEEDGV
jgi:poly(A) polymerase